MIHTDEGVSESIDVINRRLSLDGKYVIDVGCGAMAFSKLLVENGATVLGIDPDSVQAEKNRAADLIEGLEFFEGSADALPVSDSSVDGVTMMHSLHHIPESIFPQTFAEVFRVLRPGGFLIVIEPVFSPLFEVVNIFHDETELWAAAQSVLQKIAVPRFQEVELVTYHGYTSYDSFEHFTSHFCSRSFNRMYTEQDVRIPAVQSKFEKHAPEYRFETNKQAMILRQCL